MTDHLLNDLYYKGPGPFTAARITKEAELFAMRAALVYTPTSNIPAEFVGHGKLDVWLPLVVPTIQEYLDNRSRQSVRLWVDLLQRATSKIRWEPSVPAKLTMIFHDSYLHSKHDLCAKSLIDALKESSHGRKDGVVLHYFGAIKDDDSRHLETCEIRQELVSHPSLAGTRLIVEDV